MSNSPSTTLVSVHRAASFTALAFLFSSCGSSGSSGVAVPAGPTAFATTLDSTQSVPAPVAGTRVRVTVTNLAPDLGTFQTPIWFGFHDGQFDLYDIGAPASAALERLAEDGNTTPLQDDFVVQDFGEAQGSFLGSLGANPGPITPGETVSRVFELDPLSNDNRFFSYASMVIPSNDAFIANGDPQAHAIFDVAGNFVASDFIVTGGEALDAGTETNDELPANTAFFGQATPNTGVTTLSSVQLHPGFIPVIGGGNILADMSFTEADFTGGGYEFLSFRFEELVPDANSSFGVAEIDLVGAQVQFDISASSLSGPVTGAHFHEAAVGMTGPVVLNLTDEIDTNENGEVRIQGLLPVTLDFISALRAGDIYLNLHTALNPTGELRGQISTGEAFTGSLSTAQEVPTPVTGTGVRVAVTNTAPLTGTFHTPIWMGFHDGQFDIYDLGSTAATFFPMTNALERLAEDGNVALIRDAFSTQGFGTTQSVVGGVLGPATGPIAPGETVFHDFELDPSAATNRYFSYASMIIPSNDAFVANGDPLAHEVFNMAEVFTASDFPVLGSEALDAGTEDNDELVNSTAFFSQSVADTGAVQGGNVAAHPGFNGGGRILSEPMFASADFTAMNYEFFQFSFTEVAVGPAATGTVVATLDMAQTQLTFSVTAQNLSGEVIGMHFHEAAVGMTGPVVLDVTSSIQVNENGSLTATGTENVAMTFVDALMAGEIYLNVHTGLNPAGEIRSQVTLP